MYKKGSKEMKLKMAKVRAAKKNMQGNGLLEDIYNKAKDILIDKAHSFVKDRKLISKGLAAASLNPTWAPIAGPLAGVASLAGYGKKKQMNKLFKI